MAELLVLCGCLLGVVLIESRLRVRDRKRIAKTKQESPYVEYSTAPSIADLWYDHTVVGRCGRCGMDDSPIVVGNQPSHYMYVSPKCKWCAERDNLNYHLKHNGSRRSIA